MPAGLKRALRWHSAGTMPLPRRSARATAVPARSSTSPQQRDGLHPLRHAEGQRQILPPLLGNTRPVADLRHHGKRVCHRLVPRGSFIKIWDARTFFDKEMPDVIAHNLNTTEVGFLPYLAGDRQSLEPKRGAFTGLTLQATRKDFLAAIFLGIHEPFCKPSGWRRNSSRWTKPSNSPAVWWTTLFSPSNTSCSRTTVFRSSWTARCSETRCWLWKA